MRRGVHAYPALFCFSNLRYTVRMIVDGKRIAHEMAGELKARAEGRSLRLDVVYVGENPVIEKFIGVKKRYGEKVGAKTVVHRFPQDISQEGLIEKIGVIGMDEDSTGIIVQLHLPKHHDTQAILNAIPEEKDVDVLGEKAFEKFASGNSRFIPPVAGAVKEILEKNAVSLRGKKILVLGEGRLVGKPIAAWLRFKRADFTTANSKTENLSELLENADIIISGIGKAGMIKPEMIKDGAVLIDAGTTEEGGRVAGDADPACADKCSLFTPVPGGVGPITVAALFRNLLASRK